MNESTYERVEKLIRDIMAAHEKYESIRLKSTAIKWLYRGFEAETGKPIQEVLEDSLT